MKTFKELRLNEVYRVVPTTKDGKKLTGTVFFAKGDAMRHADKLAKMPIHKKRGTTFEIIREK